MNDEFIIKLPGSDKWEAGYTWGKELEAKFPGQEANNFAYMYQDTGTPTVVAEQKLYSLKCLQVGVNDGEDWIWHLVVEHPETKQLTNYFVTAWCDYTGWPCSTWYGAL